MTIFTVLFVVILAPLLKRFARLAGFALVFPLALVFMLVKACFSPKRRKAQFAA